MVRFYKLMRYCFDQEETVSIDPLPAKRRCILDSAGAKRSRTMEGGLTCTTKGPRGTGLVKIGGLFPVKRKEIEGALPAIITTVTASADLYQYLSQQCEIEPRPSLFETN
jgi:hypothetical protein